MSSALQRTVNLSVTTWEGCWLRDALAVEAGILICPLKKHMHIHMHAQPVPLSKMGGICLLSSESYF